MAPAGPSGQMVGINRSGPCGHRFHAGSHREAAGGYCTCGTYAIGICAECRAPVCGDHSDLLGGRRLCTAQCWVSAYSETPEGRVAAECQAADEAHRLQFEQHKEAAEGQRRNAPSALLELVRRLPARLRMRQGRPDRACPATARGWLVATLADPHLENERTRYRYRDLWITEDGQLVVHSVGPREALVRGSYGVMGSAYEQRNVYHHVTRSVNRQLRSARRHDGRRWGINITVVNQPSEHEGCEPRGAPVPRNMSACLRPLKNRIDSTRKSRLKRRGGTELRSRRSSPDVFGSPLDVHSGAPLRH